MAVLQRSFWGAAARGAGYRALLKVAGIILDFNSLQRNQPERMLIVGSKSETEGLKSLVSKNYFEDRKRFQKKDVIEVIQNWMKKQPHLPSLTDDEVLVFLHACYYRAEKAKETIDNYFTLRMQAPELFTKRDPVLHLTSSFAVAYYLLLPEHCLSHEGNVVVILRLRDTDPNRANFPLEVKTCLAMLDFLIARQPFCKGLEVIMDMDGLTFAHLTKIDFSALKKFMNYVQEALPLRLRGVHVLNTIPLIHQLMAIMKPLIKAELFELIRFHTTAEFKAFTEKYIPQHVLPSDYGGKEASFEELQEQMYSEIKLAASWLEELEMYKVDESKRMGPSRWSEMNGIAGTFKKLEID